MAETTELQRLEAVIEHGLATFWDVGEALKAIRAKGLYRESHPTWAVYCKKRWGFSDRHADRLIAACKLGKDFRPMGLKSTPSSQPANERQAREVLKLPPNIQQRLLQQAAQGQKTTAAQLQQARQAIEQLSLSEKFETAAQAEAAALDELKRLEREETTVQIMRLCGRLSVLHATLPCAEAAGVALEAYIAVISGKGRQSAAA